LRFRVSPLGLTPTNGILLLMTPRNPSMDKPSPRSRRLVLKAGSALAASGWSALARSANLERVRLALDWTPNTNHIGFFVANQLGGYRDVGIELEILPYSGTATPTLLSVDRCDFGISFQHSLLFARSAGLPVVSAMAILQHVATEIAFKANRTDIQTPKDLDGKIYAGFGLPHEVSTLQQVIRNAGGLGKFETVTLKTAAYEALYAGAADFTIPYMTWEGIDAELNKQALRTFRFTDYGFPDFYQVLLAVNAQWLATHKDLAQRFVRATARGYAMAAKQPREAAQLLMSANKGVFNKPELVERSTRLLADRFFLDERGQFGTQTLSRWTAYSRFLFNAGLLKDANAKALSQEPNWSSYFANDLL